MIFHSIPVRRVSMGRDAHHLHKFQPLAILSMPERYGMPDSRKAGLQVGKIHKFPSLARCRRDSATQGNP
jgi:hypothetical protein